MKCEVVQLNALISSRLFTRKLADVITGNWQVFWLVACSTPSHQTKTVV